MVTSIHLLGGAIGIAVPLVAAIALYWGAGGAPSGLVGLVLTIALLGIPLGPLVGAAYAPRAMNATRPILVANAAAFWAAFVGMIAYGIVLSVATVLDIAAGRGDPLQTALGYIVLFAPVLIVSWAFSMPFALIGIALLRRLGRSGVSSARLAATTVAFAIAAAVTGFDALRRYA